METTAWRRTTTVQTLWAPANMLGVRTSCSRRAVRGHLPRRASARRTATAAIAEFCSTTASIMRTRIWCAFRSEKLPHFQGIDSIPTRNPLVYVNSQKRHHVPFPASSIIIIIHPSNHRSSLSPRNEVLMPLGFGIRPSTRETASTASTLAGQ